MSVMSNGAKIAIGSVLLGQNSPGQSPSTPAQSTTASAADIANILKQSIQTATQVGNELLKNGNFPQAARSLFQVANLVIGGNASVMQLDKAVQQLDKDVPGTTKLIQEMSSLMNKTLSAIPQKDIPPALQPLADKATKMTASFDKFMTSYNDYQSSGTFSRWWNGKGVQVLKDWSAFKGSYGETEKEALSIVNTVKNKIGSTIQDPSKIPGVIGDLADELKSAPQLGRDLGKLAGGVLKNL